jgi:hypothetical protein
MNKFVGWSLLHRKDAKCGICGMEEKDKGDCCKDEHKHFKLNTDHQKSNVTQLITFNGTPILFLPVVDFDIHSYSTITETYPTSHAPPDIGKERLYVLYCIFLI